MKKQVDIALRRQYKDVQLGNKDKAISTKECQMNRLENELLRDKGNYLKLESVERKKAGIQVSKIAKPVVK